MHVSVIGKYFKKNDKEEEDGALAEWGTIEVEAEVERPEPHDRGNVTEAAELETGPDPRLETSITIDEDDSDNALDSAGEEWDSQDEILKNILEDEGEEDFDPTRTDLLSGVEEVDSRKLLQDLRSFLIAGRRR